MDFAKLIKKLDDKLILINVDTVDDTLYINCYKDVYEATCPYCNEKSSSVHSTYIRTIKDFPIQEYQVKLNLLAHKYFVITQNVNIKHLENVFLS